MAKHFPRIFIILNPSEVFTLRLEGEKEMVDVFLVLLFGANFNLKHCLTRDLLPNLKIVYNCKKCSKLHF